MLKADMSMNAIAFRLQSQLLLVESRNGLHSITGLWLALRHPPPMVLVMASLTR